MPYKFGKVFKKLRVENNLSYEAIAEKCNITKSQYGRLERDEVYTDIVSLERLAKAYNITVIDIITLAEDELSDSKTNTNDYIKKLEEDIKQLKNENEHLKYNHDKYIEKLEEIKNTIELLKNIILELTSKGKK